MIRTKLVECYGSLKHVRTEDEDFLRKNETEDEDRQMVWFGSPYSLDRDKILAGKSLRRLSGKTQVMTTNPNSHVRTRLSHTHEVVAVAASIARILGLNENLCVAGSLGHDIGHTPFGHTGEKFLSKISGKEFRHEVFGVVVAQKIERRGKGLNLTKQTLECMLRHSRGSGDLSVDSMVSEEANVVMYADKISYIWSDYNDMFCSNRASNAHEEYPELIKLANWFGKNQRERTLRCISALCIESANAGRVVFQNSEEAQKFVEVKNLMYKIYGRYNFDSPDAVGRVYSFLQKVEPNTNTSVLFALMSDRDVLSIAKNIAPCLKDLQKLSVAEIIPHIRNREIDFTNPDLEW